MEKSSNRALFDVPAYLQPFRRVDYKDIGQIAKSILNGTFDEQADKDKLNIFVYNALDRFDKPYFKQFFLKHVDQKVLDGEIDYEDAKLTKELAKKVSLKS